MPTISEFFGIVVMMYFRGHNPPHFHARYAGQKAAIDIRSGVVMEGDLPPRALRMLEEWRGLHQAELLVNWERSQEKLPPQPIEPLE